VPKDIYTLQKRSKVWGASNAPDSTSRTTWKHLREEFLDELQPAITLLEDQLKTDPNALRMLTQKRMAAVAEEMADQIILLAQLANKYGIDLDSATWIKWKKVEARRYVKGDDGVYRHVKE